MCPGELRTTSEDDRWEPSDVFVFPRTNVENVRCNLHLHYNVALVLHFPALAALWFQNCFFQTFYYTYYSTEQREICVFLVVQFVDFRRSASTSAIRRNQLAFKVAFLSVSVENDLFV